LAVVLAVNVAAYSRLMGADEVGTLAALKKHRREVVDPAIAAHNDRTVRGTGVGWSQVVGRLGSLLGPMVGGVLVSQGMSSRHLIQISSIAALLSGTRRIST
jgi:class 3 adenylate cyclase